MRRLQLHTISISVLQSRTGILIMILFISTFLFQIIRFNYFKNNGRKYSERRGDYVDDEGVEPDDEHYRGSEVADYEVSESGITEANTLGRAIRILCIVYTSTNNTRKLMAVKETWGRRCNKIAYISNVRDPELQTITLPDVKDGHKFLWTKTRAAMIFAWENLRDEFDWLVKADDDTYLILENLRLFLKDYNPEDPFYFGCIFQPPKMRKYASGGASYVLSKEALRLLVQDIIPDKSKKCYTGEMKPEDLSMGDCLLSVGIEPTDSRDEHGRHRFMAFSPRSHAVPATGNFTYMKWYHTYSVYSQERGPECCSTTSISFHYVTPEIMYELDFFIYYIQPYGIHSSPEESFTPEDNMIPLTGKDIIPRMSW